MSFSAFGRIAREGLSALCVAAFVLALVPGCNEEKPVAKRSPSSVRPAVPSTPTVSPGVCAPAVCPPIPAAPAYVPLTNAVVILDAGHGGNDSGAVNAGLSEKDVNLAMVRETGRILQQRGVKVLYTRSDDRFIPLPDRSAFANKNPGAVFVAIHMNSAANTNASGPETFVLSPQFTDAQRAATASAKFKVVSGQASVADMTTRCRADSRDLAAKVQRSMVARLGEVDRGVKTANFAVLRETYLCPAILVEVGFITNPHNLVKLASSNWRTHASTAIADGICNYLREGGRRQSTTAK